MLYLTLKLLLVLCVKVVSIVGKALSVLYLQDPIQYAQPWYLFSREDCNQLSQSVYFSTRSMQQAGYQIKVFVLLQTILPLRFVH